MTKHQVRQPLLFQCLVSLLSVGLLLACADDGTDSSPPTSEADAGVPPVDSGPAPASVDECALQTDDCHDLATCADTAEGFTCTCPQGADGDGRTGGTGCTTADECAAQTDDCHELAVCSDTAEGFSCTCSQGYEGDGLAGGTGCTNLDECAADVSTCADHGVCTDTEGSFTCACSEGYEGDGQSAGTGCTNIDECATGITTCGEHGTCVDIDPVVFQGHVLTSYCTCEEGWEGDGATCTDVNECSQGLHDCDIYAGCTNTEGGFTCACNEGLQGDGHTCAFPFLDQAIVDIAAMYLAIYRQLREAISAQAFDPILDLDSNGTLTVLDIIAAQCIAHTRSDGYYFRDLVHGCPVEVELATNLFLEMDVDVETDCVVDADCMRPGALNNSCAFGGGNCRCLPLGRSGLSECQPLSL